MNNFLKKIEYIDFDQQKDRTKLFTWIPNLYFSKSLKKCRIRLDNNLSICRKEDHEPTKVIEEYVKEKWRTVNLNSTFLLYKYSKDGKYYFEAEDRVRRFLVAVRILYGKKCDSLIGMTILGRKNKHYKIDDYSNYTDNQRDLMTDVNIRRIFNLIESGKQLKNIKKIYKNLGVCDIEDFNKYSPLHNSIKFLEHAYDKGWTLLRIMLLFISLESILGEKTEIAYKISLRASYLMYPNNLKERVKVFNFLKKAYGIRSSFSHGGNVEKEINKLTQGFQKDKQNEYYGFHDSFVEDLQGIVISCLRTILLDDKLTKLFSDIKNKDTISKYLDDIVVA